MGRKKTTRKLGKKAKAVPLERTFRCLFCGHSDSVTVKMNKSDRVGRLDCKDCRQSFQTPVTHLSQAVDVYSDWIDACEEVNQAENDADADTGADNGGGGTSAPVSNSGRSRPLSEDDEDDF